MIHVGFWNFLKITTFFKLREYFFQEEMAEGLLQSAFCIRLFTRFNWRAFLFVFTLFTFIFWFARMSDYITEESLQWKVVILVSNIICHISIISRGPFCVIRLIYCSAISSNSFLFGTFFFVWFRQIWPWIVISFQRRRVLFWGTVAVPFSFFPRFLAIYLIDLASFWYV